MNKRIQELAEQAELNATLLFNKDKLEKFAELIVKECAKSAYDWYQHNDQLHWDPATHILAHFGVEE